MLYDVPGQRELSSAMSVCLISSHHVSSQVNAEDGDGSQGQGDVDNDEEQEGGDLWDVAGQGVSNGLLQVVKDQPACRENIVTLYTKALIY